MNLLLDTHLLLWAAEGAEQLPERAHAQMADTRNTLLFSVASLWELQIKQTLGRPDFHVDVRRLRRGLLTNCYVELEIQADHVMALAGLPALHKDPFDRLLLAQAMAEGITLLTADAQLAPYGDPVCWIAR